MDVVAGERIDEKKRGADENGYLAFESFFSKDGVIQKKMDISRLFDDNLEQLTVGRALWDKDGWSRDNWAL